MLRRTILAAMFGLFSIASQTNADVILTYGNDEGGTRVIDLEAETANQAIQIFATGIVAEGGADGLESDMHIGDGGGIFGGSDTSPLIESIDLITGTIWENSNPNQQDVVTDPLARQSTVDTSSLVNEDGLIATVFIDTTGFGIGEINFLLSGVGGSFDTTVFQGATGLVTDAPNGVLRITEGRSGVPEPSSAAILIMVGLVGVARRRRVA